MDLVEQGHASASAAIGTLTADQLQAVLQQNHRAFLKVAGMVAEVHERIDGPRGRKAQYLKELNENHRANGGVGNVPDPFELAGKLTVCYNSAAVRCIRCTRICIRCILISHIILITTSMTHCSI
jgi:hypothetical protein